MSDNRNSAAITHAHVSLAGLCIRKGCSYSSQMLMHTLRVCTPTGLTPCNRKDCLTPAPHGVHDCDPRFTPCLRTEHAEFDDHLVIDCIGNPAYGVSTSKELVLYTGPNLVHVPSIHEIPEDDEPIETQGCPDWTNCPVKGDHKPSETCEQAGARYQNRQHNKKFKSNKITLAMRLKRFVRNIRFGKNHSIDIVELIANIPLALGIVNGAWALGMLVATTAQVMETTPLNPIAALISASFYGFVFMTVLSAATTHLEIPSNPRFDRFKNRLTVGYAAIGTSCAFELSIHLYSIARR